LRHAALHSIARATCAGCAEVPACPLSPDTPAHAQRYPSPLESYATETSSHTPRGQPRDAPGAYGNCPSPPARVNTSSSFLPPLAWPAPVALQARQYADLQLIPPHLFVPALLVS